MRKSSSTYGFTLIELLVVMAIVATLLALVGPRYFRNVDRAKEVVLKENLAQARDAIDKFHADRGKYPVSLDELVEQKYLRRVPLDPVTESSSTWQLIPPEDKDAGGVYDIKSGAPGNASDGAAYADW